MSRYADVEKMPSGPSWDALNDKEKAAVLSFLIKLPTVDAVEVVRCEDCEYARKVRNMNQEDYKYICCYFRDNPDTMDVVDYYRFMVRPDGYCYRSAKMDKEKEE